MSFNTTRFGRLGAVAATTVVIASLTLVPVASGASSPAGTLAVTGGSASKIELTLTDPSAQFGTGLTPDGNSATGADANVAANVDGVSTPSVGACYEWPGSLDVRSNMPYTVTVSSASTNSSLFFLTANPTSYAQCVGGEPVVATVGAPVTAAMFFSANPQGSWLASQTRTPNRNHEFWLGLRILWADAPSTTVGAGSLVLTATTGS